MAHKNDLKFRFQCPQIKFYWHTATSIHWHTACGCLHTPGAELSSYNKDHMAKAENINWPTLPRKCLQVPWSRPTARSTVYSLTLCRHSPWTWIYTIDGMYQNNTYPPSELDPIFSVLFSSFCRVSCSDKRHRLWSQMPRFTFWFYCSLCDRGKLFNFSGLQLLH